MAGVALGLVTGGGVGAGVLSAAGVLNQGTKAAEIGKSLGEIAGGAALMLFGGGGTVAGAVATVSGIGTAAGVPAVVGSAALVAGGADNIAAGIQGLTQALSTGAAGGTPPKAGSSGGPGAGKRFSEGMKDAVEAQAGGKCVFCGKETSRVPGPRQRNTDHAVPKSRGGNNTLDNAQNTCRECNLEKSTRTTEEYLNGKP